MPEEASHHSLLPGGMKILVRIGIFLFCGALPAIAQVASPIPEESSKIPKLNWQQGDVAIGDKLATVHLPPEFRFLSPDDSRKVLVDVWRNPPKSANGVLGMIFPVAQGSERAADWAVVITYLASGFVKDSDAEKIDYDDLLKQLEKEAEAANPEREKQGYPAINVIGWAEPPHYDQSARKLYWAKELKFGNSPVTQLNYSIRELGRAGVLELNAIASAGELAEIRAKMPAVLNMVEFNPGNRYADFKPDTDKVAAFGLGALILGGVAAKAGLLKGLLVLLGAGWKFIAVGIVAVLAFFRRIFARKKVDDSSSSGKPRLPLR